MRGTWLALAFAALVAAACGLTDPAGGGDVIDRETFIEVYVELRRAGEASADSAEFRRRRDAILDAHDLDAEALEAFVRAHGDDVRLLSEVWDTIRARLESPPPQTDSART